MQIPALPPVVLSADESLLAALARAAAAATVVPDVHRAAAGVLPVWGSAPAVLVGADRAAELAALALPRRPQVHVVSAGPPDGQVYADALGCGAVGVLELPREESRLVDLLTDAADGRGRSGVLVGVVGGCGGAGATTFAAALGLVLAEMLGSALLVDADPHGGGVEEVLGIRGGGVRWDVLGESSGRLSARSLRETLPGRDGLAVVAWPSDRAADVAPSTVRAVLSAGRRGYPAVVVDLPRSGGRMLDPVLIGADHLFVLSTVTVPGLAACRQLVGRLPFPPTAVVLRGRAGPPPGEVERFLGVPVWHRMVDQRGVDEAVSLGLGPLRSRRGPLARTARQVAGALVPGPRP